MLTGSTCLAAIESVIHSGRTTGVGFLHLTHQVSKIVCRAMLPMIAVIQEAPETSYAGSPLLLKDLDFGSRQIAADNVRHPVTIIVHLKSSAIQPHQMS